MNSKQKLGFIDINVNDNMNNSKKNYMSLLLKPTEAGAIQNFYSLEGLLHQKKTKLKTHSRKFNAKTN